jgi:hypothetical protein
LLVVDRNVSHLLWSSSAVMTEEEETMINQMMSQVVALRLALVCCRLWDVNLTEREEQEIEDLLGRVFS